LQGEDFILAGINVSTCRDKYFSLRRTKVMDSSEICNRQCENNYDNTDSQGVAWVIFVYYLCDRNNKRALLSLRNFIY
jgi:hypothetical protein